QCAGAAVPDRLAGALRVGDDRGNGVRHAHHRPSVRLGAGDRRRRTHGLCRRHTRRACRRGQARADDRPCRVSAPRRRAVYDREDGRRVRSHLPVAHRVSTGCVTTPDPRDDLVVGNQYYILASSVAADLPKLVLKHDEAFLVADRRGDFPGLAETEFGFYADGTRFLRQLELRVGARRPLVLNATLSEDALEAAIELTNPDVPEAERTLRDRDPQLESGRTLRISRRLTLYRDQVYQALIVESFARARHDLEFEWLFAADFIDVFEARGHRRARRGLLLPALHASAALTFQYRGLD